MAACGGSHCPSSHRMYMLLRRAAGEDGKDGDMRRIALALAGRRLPGTGAARARVRTAGRATMVAGTATTTTIDNDFLDTERDLDGLPQRLAPARRAAGAPESEGDRGGAVQLATFGVMGLGMVFIGWRIDAAVSPPRHRAGFADVVDHLLSPG